MKRVILVLCSLGICYCLEGTPEQLRNAEAADRYCQRAEEIAELWAAASNANEAPEEAQILVRPTFAFDLHSALPSVASSIQTKSKEQAKS